MSLASVGGHSAQASNAGNGTTAPTAERAPGGRHAPPRWRVCLRVPCATQLHLCCALLSWSRGGWFPPRHASVQLPKRTGPAQARSGAYACSTMLSDRMSSNCKCDHTRDHSQCQLKLCVRHTPPCAAGLFGRSFHATQQFAHCIRAQRVSALSTPGV